MTRTLLASFVVLSLAASGLTSMAHAERKPRARRKKEQPVPSPSASPSPFPSPSPAPSPLGSPAARPLPARTSPARKPPVARAPQDNGALIHVEDDATFRTEPPATKLPAPSQVPDLRDIDE